MADHITIGSNIRVGAQSGIVHSILEPGDYHGHPAIPIFDSKRNAVVFRKLYETIKSIRTDIKELREKFAG